LLTGDEQVYYADLTPFEYGNHECPEKAEILNIGWLGDKVESQGIASPIFLNALKYLVQNKINTRYRGTHTCEICGSMNYRGNGQIQVQGEGNKWYVAPAMIVHYVEDHEYMPPQEFIEAVIRSV
jgi:hypothetical protein